jgi:hypothetical protein
LSFIAVGNITFCGKNITAKNDDKNEQAYVDQIDPYFGLGIF